MCVRGYRCVCKGIVSVFSDPLLSTPVWAANFRQILTLDLGEVSVLSEYRQALEAKEICVLVPRCPYKQSGMGCPGPCVICRPPRQTAFG